MMRSVPKLLATEAGDDSTGNWLSKTEAEQLASGALLHRISRPFHPGRLVALRDTRLPKTRGASSGARDTHSALRTELHSLSQI